MTKHIQIIAVILIILTGCTGKMPKLGIENGRLAKCPDSPNCVNSQAENTKHRIEPIRISSTPMQAQNRILRVLKELKRSKIIVTEENYIRAEFTSRIFRFVDDVEFYILPAKGTQTVIHVRSASRVGYSDLGVNRKRIEQIRNRLKEIQ